MTPGQGQNGTSRPRGRPSLAAPFTPQITQCLRENPRVSSAEILRRVQVGGYRGRKSALYELVKRLRTSRAAERVNTPPSSTERHTRG